MKPTKTSPANFPKDGDYLLEGFHGELEVIL